MKKLYFLLLGLITLTSFAQVSNQNPNHKKASLEYSKNYKEVIVLQGTTSEETYEAYDYIELKEKERKERRYWRHLERLAYNSSPKTYLNSWGWNYYDNPWGWDYGWNNWNRNPGWGLGLGFYW